MEDKGKQVEEYFEGAMSLYNTIDIELNKKENTYTNAKDKIEEINKETPVYVPDDDSLATMLFQYANVGYGVCGLKYLDMILNNKGISVMAFGYTLQKLNQLAEENQKLALENEQLKERLGIDTKEFEGIKDEELKGISE